ncbi:MAG: DNA repair protein RecN [Oscillospiraceae bacterium]|nr:DNA repair protein RecN [Oscillospiraceae bacterium]
MLNTLEIQNFALIDQLSIDFKPGLNILTGETGAGKSIIIDSINAVLGARLTREVIRTGAGSALITAVFSIESERARQMLKEGGVTLSDADDEPLIISREININGRSSIRFNGRLTPVSLVKAIGELLLDLHGQYDNHSLIKREKHGELLDNFGGKGILQVREEYIRCYQAYQATARRIRELSSDEAQRARNIDMFAFQMNEIENARIKPDEDEQLESRIRILANAERILLGLKTAFAALSAGESGGLGAMEQLNAAVGAMSDICVFSEAYNENCEKLRDISYQLEEITTGIRRAMDDVDFDPGELDMLNERMDVIDRLKRKYGGSIARINEFYTYVKKKLSEMTDSDSSIGALKKEGRELGQRLTALADELTRKRRLAAKTIEDKIGVELASLEMGKAGFRVKIEQLSGYTGRGRDRVEFLFSAGGGEELKPLSKIASGGEMSRIMLAIKSVLADADNIPTMIFDEIDAGISGKAGLKVGEKMYGLSRGRQIISVTHLAQIACHADANYLISKTFDGEKAVTEVAEIQGESRVNEISRLLGEDMAAEASRRLASEMLQKAQEFKSEYPKAKRA